MAATKAPKRKTTKKAGPKRERRVSTFRLFDEDREGLDRYALKLGLLMEPAKRLSKNDAVLHMIKHSDIILKELARKGKKQSEPAPASV